MAERKAEYTPHTPAAPDQNKALKELLSAVQSFMDFGDRSGIDKALENAEAVLRKARLVAAAPELLEVAKDLRGRLHLALKCLGNPPDICDLNVKKADAVIREADGEE